MLYRVRSGVDYWSVYLRFARLACLRSCQLASCSQAPGGRGNCRGNRAQVLAPVRLQLHVPSSIKPKHRILIWAGKHMQDQQWRGVSARAGVVCACSAPLRLTALVWLLVSNLVGTPGQSTNILHVRAVFSRLWVCCSISA